MVELTIYGETEPEHLQHVGSGMKASTDKHDLSRKLIALLRPRYGTAFKQNLPVLETMLYAICLEDATPDEADTSYGRLFSDFNDLNEVRVSTIYELEKVFEGMPHPDLRGLRVKSTLHYVFEETYGFDFELLRRKTQEKAVKDLNKIKGLSTFCREYTLQHALDNHVLPIDGSMNKVLVWLGVTEASSNPEHTSETLRGFVRKADAQLFCHLLHSVATDSAFRKIFDEQPPAEGEAHGAARLQEVLAGGPRKGARQKVEKRDEKKTPVAAKSPAKPAPDKLTADKASGEKASGAKASAKSTAKSTSGSRQTATAKAGAAWTSPKKK